MFIIIKIVSDMFFISFSYIAAYLLRFNVLSIEGIFSIPYNRYYYYIFSILLLYLFFFYLFGMYKKRKGFLIKVDEFLDSFFSITSAWIVLIVLTFIKGEYQYSRHIILLSWPISLLFIVISRQIVLHFELKARAKGYDSKRAAILGTGDLALSLSKRMIEHPSYGVNFIGFVGLDGNNCLGSLMELDKIVKENNIQVLFVADKKIAREKLIELASFCDQYEIALASVPDIFSILTTSPALEDVEGIPIIRLKGTRFTPLNRFIKRTFDIVFSLIGIIVFIIPMLIISIFISIFSPGGPVIYYQERVGREGKTFRLLKFRTMIPDAEKETGPVLASGDDPRKTTIGNFLRKTRLDELPQFFNILRGDMSFVGPRPERPVFVDQFKNVIPKYFERHKIRPGIAGWAQFQGGYHMPAEEKIKYDLYYIENWSFLLDIKILIKCVLVVLSFSGGE